MALRAGSPAPEPRGWATLQGELMASPGRAVLLLAPEEWGPGYIQPQRPTLLTRGPILPAHSLLLSPPAPAHSSGAFGGSLGQLPAPRPVPGQPHRTRDPPPESALRWFTGQRKVQSWRPSGTQADPTPPAHTHGRHHQSTGTRRHHRSTGVRLPELRTRFRILLNTSPEEARVQCETCLPSPQ